VEAKVEVEAEAKGEIKEVAAVYTRDRAGYVVPYLDAHVPRRPPRHQCEVETIDEKTLTRIQSGEEVEMKGAELRRWCINLEDGASANRNVPHDLRFITKRIGDDRHLLQKNPGSSGSELNYPRIKKRVEALGMPIWSYFGAIPTHAFSAGVHARLYEFPKTETSSSRVMMISLGDSPTDKHTRTSICDNIDHVLDTTEALYAVRSCSGVAKPLGLVFFPDQARLSPFRCWGVMLEKVDGATPIRNYLLQHPAEEKRLSTELVAVTRQLYQRGVTVRMCNYDNAIVDSSGHPLVVDVGRVDEPHFTNCTQQEKDMLTCLQRIRAQ